MITYLKKDVFQDACLVHIVMRHRNPGSKLYAKLRPLLAIHQRSESSSGVLGRIVSGILIRLRKILDFLDLNFRYAYGWIMSRFFGRLVIYERFPTDIASRQIGGYSAYHVFPKPDVLIYLDVNPVDSIARKPADGHRLEVQGLKRANYLSFLSKYKNAIVIPANDLQEVRKEVLGILNNELMKYKGRLRVHTRDASCQ